MTGTAESGLRQRVGTASGRERDVCNRLLTWVSFATTRGADSAEPYKSNLQSHAQDGSRYSHGSVSDRLIVETPVAKHPVAYAPVTVPAATAQLSRTCNRISI